MMQTVGCYGMKAISPYSVIDFADDFFFGVWLLLLVLQCIESIQYSSSWLGFLLLQLDLLI